MKMKKQKAFTLIELLVVIAIIALLLSVMTPALRKAKIYAQSIVCMSNLNSLSKCWHLYAEDHKGQLVGGFTQGKAQGDWVNVPIGTKTDPIEREKDGIMDGLLYDYAQDVQLYHCPSDRGIQLFNGGYRSYSITALMNGEGYNDGKNATDKYFAIKMTDIVNPASRIVFLENTDDRGYNMGSWMMPISKTPAKWIDPLAVWHGNRSTFGFADGHAETHAWVDKSTLEMTNIKTGDIRIDFPIPSNESHEDYFWMLRGYMPKGQLPN
jgi:prepilin-type N-terminal cleavage/methylation domain-containing protein/prepilin-type processing-associated H-X9-DG protein